MSDFPANDLIDPGCRALPVSPIPELVSLLNARCFGISVDVEGLWVQIGALTGGFGLGFGFFRRFGLGLGGAPIVSDAPSTGMAAAPSFEAGATSGLSPKLSTVTDFPGAGGSAGAVTGMRVNSEARIRPAVIALDVIAMRSE